MDAAHIMVVGSLPVDREVARYRAGEARSAIREFLRLASKPYEELSIDGKYSMRYNLIVLVGALAYLCIHIAVEEYGKTPSSYREALRVVAERLAPEVLQGVGGPCRPEEPAGVSVLDGR